MSVPARWGLAAGLLLLVAGGLPRGCLAMVVMQTGNFSMEFASLPADFGAPIPPEGLTGLLLPAQPEDACSELTPPKQAAGEPWVALIARSQQKAGCTFDVKVAHAEAAGAVAAVVYDDVFEPLILMAKDPSHPDPFIPAAFVTQKSGILMKRLLVPGETVATLTPLSEALWLSMVMSAAAGFLAVNVVLGALWVIRRQHGTAVVVGGPGGRQQQRPGMTASEIRALPVVVFEEPAGTPRGGGGGSGSSGGGGGGGGAADAEADEEQGGLQTPAGGSDSGSDAGARGGGTRRLCAICLERYSHGDKLRVLPCQHRYHSCCIDQWLSSRRPVCPVCKADAHAPRGAPPHDDEEAGGGGDEEAGGRLPARRQRRRRRQGAAAALAGRLGAGWAALRGRWLGAGAGAGAAPEPPAAGEEQHQQLLAAGSRTSSPIPAAPAGAAPAPPEPESAATLANFPAFFPPRLLPSSAAEPEIVPFEGTEAVAGPPAAPSPRRAAAAPSDSASSSPRAGPHAHLLLVQPDSTEGSETESELE